MTEDEFEAALLTGSVDRAAVSDYSRDPAGRSTWDLTTDPGKARDGSGLRVRSAGR